MPFRSVFIALVLGTALIIAALLVHARRPGVERNEPTAALAEATGKCAECHRRETPAIVVEFEQSKHAQKGINAASIATTPPKANPGMDHNGFVIAKSLTAKNCAACHAREYDQFARSRHAAPAWASVNGPKDFSPDQVALGERYHPTWVNRSPMSIGAIEGAAAIANGCNACHAIGKPNADGVPSGPVRTVTRATSPRSSSLGNRRRAASATWVQITRSSRSTASRSTARSSRPSGRA